MNGLEDQFKAKALEKVQINNNLGLSSEERQRRSYG